MAKEHAEYNLVWEEPPHKKKEKNITKTRLYNNIEYFTTKKMKNFR